MLRAQSSGVGTNIGELTITSGGQEREIAHLMVKEKDELVSMPGEPDEWRPKWKWIASYVPPDQVPSEAPTLLWYDHRDGAPPALVPPPTPIYITANVPEIDHDNKPWTQGWTAQIVVQFSPTDLNRADGKKPGEWYDWLVFSFAEDNTTIVSEWTDGLGEATIQAYTRFANEAGYSMNGPYSNKMSVSDWREIHPGS